MTRDEVIGDWRFDAAAGELRTSRGATRLEDRSARTLALLCRHRGEVVSKTAILAEVWNGRTVSANSVAIVVADLRRAFGEDASAPRLIETVGKRGYRLTMPVAVAPEQAGVRRPAWVRRRGWWAAAGVAIAMAAPALLLVRHAPSHPPVALVVGAVRNDTGQSRYDSLATALSALVEDRVARFPGVVAAEAGERPAGAAPDHRWELRSRLVIWNDTPTLSLSAVDPSDGRVAWSGMAVGRPDRIANVTIARLAELRRALPDGR